VHGGSIFLWSEDGGARPLDGYPGTFESGSDVGTSQCHVVRLTESGEVSPVSDVCVHGLWSVSRSGRWALTEDLHLVDVRTGASRNLSVRPVSNLYTHRKVWWDGDDSLLIPAGDWLVRCSTADATCERVTGPEKGLALP
jgi:hypothetical protein